MKKIITKIGLVIIIWSLIQGCVSINKTTKVLSRISLDMTKTEVAQKIGEPNSVRGSVKNKHGVVIEVWEYRLCSHATLGPKYSSGVHAIYYHYDLYWLYFANDKLMRWGKAGDWRKEADKINEIRFR